ncbi:slit -like protein [Brachionus plicatilis]|uniref:Slit-like protein n=1 Tax=Brachionus plicatilis TaxID=10195 RepID=A0A3M7RXW0_BRAPC|nr:slit -like protein [Brachionus plicatilis]
MIVLAFFLLTWSFGKNLVIVSSESQSIESNAQLKNCPSDLNICRNNGICYYTDAGSITCNCPLPYNGTFCQISNVFCDLNPCKNGATCEQTEEYDGKCICPPGYQGRTCDTKPCDLCKNALTCLQTDDKFVCLCRPGYSGDYCEISF